MSRAAAVRTIEFGGETSITVAGSQSDPYFATLGASPRSDALLIRSVQSLRDNAVIFDVGANIGVTASLMARIKPAATIHAFEPAASAWPFLKQTIALNGASDRCHPHQVAMGRSKGIAPFLDNTVSASGSHIATPVTSLTSGTTTVRVATVDQMVAALGIRALDFIKIDVEGSEPDVLDGAVETLARLRPTVMVEFNSYTLIAIRNLNPRTVLEDWRTRFRRISWFDGERLVEIADDNTMLHFLHENLVRHATVDDLLCEP